MLEGETADFTANVPAANEGFIGGTGKTIQPEANFQEQMTGQKDYGAMIDAALAEGVPAAPEAPEANSLPEMDYTPVQPTATGTAPPVSGVPVGADAAAGPAAPSSPGSALSAETGVPQGASPAAAPAATTPMPEPVLPMPSEEVTLPPPPAPDFSNAVPVDGNGVPVLPPVQEAAAGAPQGASPAPASVATAPVAAPVEAAPATDPAAFRIPGM